MKKLNINRKNAIKEIKSRDKIIKANNEKKKKGKLKN